MGVMQPLLPLTPKLGPIREVQFLLVQTRRVPCQVHLNLLVVVILLIPAHRIEILDILGAEESGEDEGSDRHQCGEEGGVDVPNIREVGNHEDGQGAEELHKRPGHSGAPLHLRHHRDFGPLLLNHEAEADPLPDLVPVKGSDAEVQEQSKQDSAGDPSNNGEHRQRHEHEDRLSQSRPPLLLHVRHPFPHDAVLVLHMLPGAKGPNVQRRLGDQAITGRQTQYRARQEGHAQHEKVQVVRGRFLQVELGRLTQDGADIVIDDEQEEEHETGDEGTEDARGGNAREGRGDPGTIDGRFPIPRTEFNVDAIQGISLIDPGQVRQGRHHHDGDEGVVTGQDGADLSGEVRPGLREVQRPRDVVRQYPQEQRRVLSGAVGPVAALPQVHGLNEIPQGCIDERNGDEQFEDLGREGRDLPDQTDKSNHGREHVHESSPEAHPEEEGEVIGIEGFGQGVGGAQEDGDGTRDAHDHHRLTRKYRVYDPDHRRTQQNLRGRQVPLRLPPHQLCKDERRYQLYHKREDRGVDDREGALGLGPVVAVQGSARRDVLTDSGHELDEGFRRFGFGGRGSGVCCGGVVFPRSLFVGEGRDPGGDLLVQSAHVFPLWVVVALGSGEGAVSSDIYRERSVGRDNRLRMERQTEGKGMCPVGVRCRKQRAKRKRRNQKCE
mmetsp:Transcript_8400/g.17825  ORF Transcript_8400/g.17825 Transcript_8400/m.17825 type:complete len:665 (+) Transcript_8400:140-2134(+)